MLVDITEKGLFCPDGDFHIDPSGPVPRAVITHAHGDHLTPGCGAYLASVPSVPLMRCRLGPVSVQALKYGDRLHLGGTEVSLHPAGHILGSAHVRIECRGEVWDISGDYKRMPDPTCTPFEPVRCHCFVTESTFGLPIFRWPDADRVIESIHSWWSANAEHGRTSVLFVYALGKAQRILSALDPSHGPILLHGAIRNFIPCYSELGIAFPPYQSADVQHVKAAVGKAIVLTPSSLSPRSWLRSFGSVSLASASGWMRIHGNRRRASLDRGFVLSDHADWDGLNQTVIESGAERILVVHGYADVFSRWLCEQGQDASALHLPFAGEPDEDLRPDAPPTGEGDGMAAEMQSPGASTA